MKHHKYIDHHSIKEKNSYGIKTIIICLKKQNTELHNSLCRHYFRILRNELQYIDTITNNLNDPFLMSVTVSFVKLDINKLISGKEIKFIFRYKLNGELFDEEVLVDNKSFRGRITNFTYNIQH